MDIFAFYLIWVGIFAPLAFIPLVVWLEMMDDYADTR
jgi:hypothetical protein